MTNAVNKLRTLVTLEGAAKHGQSAVEVAKNTMKIEAAADKAAKKSNKLDRAVDKNTTSMKKGSRAMRDFAGSIAIVQGPLGPVAGRLNALGAAMGRLNLGAFAFTASMTALVAVMGKAIKSAASYEKQMFKLEAIIKSTGGTAGLTAEEIDEFSKKLGRDTLTSADAVRDASAALMSFRTISGDSFKATLIAAQDLAAAMGTDLMSATKQLAKAMEDPINGLTLLQRSGIMFSQSQKEAIKDASKLGDTLTAQNIILAEVNRTTGGAGKGEAGGLIGAIDTLGENFESLFQTLGQNSVVFDMVTRALRNMSEYLADIDLYITSIDRAGKFQGLNEAIFKSKKNVQDIKDTLADIAAGDHFDKNFPQEKQDKITANLKKQLKLAEARLQIDLKAAGLAVSPKRGKGKIPEKEVDTTALANLESVMARKFETQMKWAEKARIASLAAGQTALVQEQVRYEAEVAAAVEANAAFQALKGEDNGRKAEAQTAHDAAMINLATTHGAKKKEILDKIAADEQKRLDDMHEAEVAVQQAKSDALVKDQEYFALQAEMAAIAGDDKETRAIAAFDKELERIEASRAVMEEANLSQTEIEDEVMLRREIAEEIHWAKIAKIRKAETDRAYKAMDDQSKFFAAVGEGDLKTATAMGAKLTKAMAKESRAGFEANKAFSIASATIQGYDNAVAAYGMGLKTSIPGAAEAFAAVSIAFTAAQIQAIASTSFSGGGSAGGVPSVSGGITPSEPPAPREDQAPSFEITVIQTGNGTEFVDTVVIPQLQDRILHADIKIIDDRSRQAQDLKEAVGVR